MTTPLPTEPLLDLNRLAVWAQENPLSDPEFAALVIDTVSVLLRHYGDPAWTLETLPPRARDIGYFVTRNYYLNPDLVRQESIGPIQTTVDNKVLQGIDLTPEQQLEIAALAGPGADPTVIDGIWTASFTRGPVEMDRVGRHGTVVVYDTRGGWPIEYLDGSEVVVFMPEEPEVP